MNAKVSKTEWELDMQSLYSPTAMLVLSLSGLVAGEKAMSKVEILRELGS